MPTDREAGAKAERERIVKVLRSVLKERERYMAQVRKNAHSIGDALDVGRQSARINGIKECIAAIQGDDRHG